MKQVINVYKKHKDTVDKYIKHLVKNIKKDIIEDSKEILNQYKYIQLIYSVDADFKQKSPIICRKEKDSEHIGNDKKHYFQKMILEENVYVSSPYIHYRTGKASLSVVYFKDDTYYVFDINLIALLEELKLIEFNGLHDKIKRFVYLFGSTILALVAIALLSYGSYIFGSIIFIKSHVDFLQDIFKSIIAVTLGLAIFDLAKQIFEHEVLFKTFEHDEDKEYKVLGKFLISIIIALSIETLLVVFKIALSGDVSQMLSAFYLILGTTLMFVALGWFYKTIKLASCKIDD
ncbi:hypothetical protein [Candidatus Sulfurimonas baltica]|uniref:General glycosylation pathway protein n=1 Tax=Candidatus Sulfurimonas baltica TaxID=2740404 RepID=A0A7S7LV91_9BACT|nr:hypothetical protein [Candidatus Sulfurimonas baltica]QOY51910.1 hypothetical protein HUE88_12550 [Candidatus Sulfurimonas baltica]